MRKMVIDVDNRKIEKREMGETKAKIMAALESKAEVHEI